MTKLKTIISVLMISFLLVSPSLAKSLTLWEYYDRQGLSLPSISERAEIYAKINPYELYTGTLTQNIALLDFIQLSPESTQKPYTEETFGGVGGSSELPKVTADFESSLVSRISASDTEMTLVDSADRNGTTLSGWYGFSIESDSSKKEYVIANCTGSSCSQMLRGVSFNDGVATSSARAFIHGRGTDVSITNHPNLTIITNILNGTDGIPDKIYYDDTVTISAGDNQKILTDLQYVNNLIANGVATTTQSIFGGGTEATQSQIASGFYDINDPRLITTRYASSTPTVATTTIPVTGTNGKLSQSFLDLTQPFTFTATTTSATSTAVHGDFTTLSVGSLSVPYDTASTSAASVGYVNKKTYATVSDTLQASDDTEEITTSSSYVKLKEFIVLVPGKYRVKFDGKIEGAGTYGRIYVNGQVFGTEQSFVSTSYVTKSEDLYFSYGDSVQLYAKSNGTDDAFIKNFRLYYTPQTTSSNAVLTN